MEVIETCYVTLNTYVTMNSIVRWENSAAIYFYCIVRLITQCQLYAISDRPESIKETTESQGGSSCMYT